MVQEPASTLTRIYEALSNGSTDPHGLDPCAYSYSPLF